MAITPVQSYNENTKSAPKYKSYLEVKGGIQTSNNVKPLPAQGHLVHDTLISVPKYFIKDIAYDIHSVKEALKGNANDHQAGRLNDVGLKLGGIGIATYLASRTTNPVARIMEYAGLGAFLTAMAVWPKIAINTPSELVHGFDIGKEYIDDQGRKKSVFQDSNYIPFDMYRGEYPDEDLDLIGDRLGIPRDIQNRHDLIREQMRKIATQNNTLWMLTAGLATPVLSALMCYGIEKAVSPAVESFRDMRYHSKISHALKTTENMASEVSQISSNKLEKDVAKLLEGYKGRELPKAEFDKLIQIITKDLDANTSDGIKEDLTKLLSNERVGVKSFVMGEGDTENLINTIKSNIPNRNKAVLEKVFVPSKEELSSIINRVNSNSGELTEVQLKAFKDELRTLFDKKIESEPKMAEFLKGFESDLIENISKNIQTKKSSFVSENSIKEISDFARVIGDFKKNQVLLDKCKSFKTEYTTETVIARSFNDFEKALLKSLDIKFKDLKQMRESEEFTKEILNDRLTKLAQDDAKYEKAVKRLTKIMQDMEVKLHGKSEDASHIKDLITAIENNYNNTAKRLNSIGGGKFSSTIGKLVKEDVSTLENTLKTRQDIFDLLDGTQENKWKDFNFWADENAPKRNLYARENAKGAGSSKNLEISRIIERYQGSKSAMNRFLHLLDVFKRPEAQGEYNKYVDRLGKDALMGASSSQHTLKLHTINNPSLYKDIMNTIWQPEDFSKNGVKEKGMITEATKKAMEVNDGMSRGNVLERFQQYINKFRNIIGNNNIDFTKPQHNLDPSVLKSYTQAAQTRMAKFLLVGKSPINTIKDAANKNYGTQKWMRIVSTIGASVFGAAILTQFAFGKIRNPHNIKKQVSDDPNK